MFLISILQRDGDYLSSHAAFVNRIASAFETFVESTERDCLGKYVIFLLLFNIKWWFPGQVRSYRQNMLKQEIVYSYVNLLAVCACSRCMEDLKSMTRYVTWSLHNKVIL